MAAKAALLIKARTARFQAVTGTAKARSHARVRIAADLLQVAAQRAVQEERFIGAVAASRYGSIARCIGLATFQLIQFQHLRTLGNS